MNSDPDPSPPIPDDDHPLDLPFDPNAPNALDEPEVDAPADSLIEAEEETPALPDRSRGVTPDELDSIPALPGVYLMRDAEGRVIYVGKAANLASRVRSYFTRSGDVRFNVQFLLRNVKRVETVITANEKEAFLLENTLIKKHQPRYNLRLRDDKTYVSVRINLNHDYPRAVVMRRRDTTGRKESGVLYLGPYSSAQGVRDALRQLQRVFPIRSCPDHVLRNRARPCLLHQIGRCCAPCVNDLDKTIYREMVDQTVLVLKGRAREVLANLHERMTCHAEKMEFEQAAILRDRLRSIELSAERQGVHQHEGSDRDIVVFERKGGFGAFVVFVYRGGLLVSSRPFVVRDHSRPAEELMEEFLSRYYELEPPPKELIAQPMPTGIELLESWLAERREARVQIVDPQRGEKVRLVETAQENAFKLLDQHLSGQQTVEAIAGEIQKHFHMTEPPQVIECFDISTIQGMATVGSMVTFRAGEPDKNRYRRFRIKTFEGQDDFASMREVLTRRFRKVADGSESAPGLVVIDGGKGQLAIAVDVLQHLGLANVPVVGMAKARVKRRGDTVERTEERFFLPNRSNPVLFKPTSPALYMLVRLRDEAHRFAITYHRELRGRRQLRSILEEIPGVGKTRASQLLRHFGSMKKLKEASLEEIAALPRIPRDLASRIHERLHAVPHEIPLESSDLPMDIPFQGDLSKSQPNPESDA